MTAVEIVSRVRVGGGARIEQLVPHPALPLVAGLDCERPAVHFAHPGSDHGSRRPSLNRQELGEGELEVQLEKTNGTRTWQPGELNTVTTAAESDPAWLRHRAAVNELFAPEN